MRAFRLAFALPLLIGFAATLRGAASLGPEVELSRNRDSGPAAFAQLTSALVTNGSEFLLSWIQLYELNTPNFALRLDSGGQPLEPFGRRLDQQRRSEEHTSELQPPYVISYAVF